MQVNHDLKIDEPYLLAKLRGDKLFEIRKDDRAYQKGDYTTYHSYEDGEKVQRHTYLITFVCSYMQKDGYVVFGERHLSTENI